MRNIVHSVVLLTAFFLGNNAFAQTTPDCATIMATTGDENIKKLNPADVAACSAHRGADPGPAMRPPGGVKCCGAHGFDYGTIAAPESPAGARKAPASVSAAAIRNSCTILPPRVAIGIPPQVSLPPGTCSDFLNNLFTDKTGTTNSAALAAGITDDSCPAETDTTGAYGVRQSVAGGKTLAQACGGTVPITTSDLVLNPNATSFAVIDDGSYTISAYTKSGNQFVQTLNNVALPQILCQKSSHNLMQKTVDLTAPMGQMISYNASAKSIAIRLKSRAEMDGNYIPVYVPGEVEKYLVLPLSATGVPQAPDLSQGCADQNTYFQPLSGLRDIEIVPAPSTDCTNYTFTPTPWNKMKDVCTLFNGCKWKDDWVWRCDTTEVSGPTATCAEAQGLPTTAQACPPDDPSDSCDMVTITPDPTVCPNKTLFAVLARPTLYYPPGSTATFYSLPGRTAVMAQTAANTQLYAPANTIVNIGSTAPSLTFNEGGTIYLNGAMLLAYAPAVVNAASGTVIMTNGGQLLTPGGSQLQKFPANTTYTIPGNYLQFPLEMHIGRTVNLPAGYMIPTTPTVGSQPPYIREPVDNPT